MQCGAVPTVVLLREQLQERKRHNIFVVFFIEVWLKPWPQDWGYRGSTTLDFLLHLPSGIRNPECLLPASWRV